MGFGEKFLMFLNKNMSVIFVESFNEWWVNLVNVYIEVVGLVVDYDYCSYEWMGVLVEL